MSTKKEDRPIPFAPIERIMRTSIGDGRLSQEAIVEMSNILVEFGTKISAKAIDLARYANRVTIKSEDIRLAYEQIKKI
jgi:histone H3/H4